jgi:hypothetical protein
MNSEAQGLKEARRTHRPLAATAPGGITKEIIELGARKARVAGKIGV